MYEVYEADRKNYPYEVRYNGGRSYCRCNNYRDAHKIALAMNMLKDREATLEELRLIHTDISRNSG